MLSTDDSEGIAIDHWHSMTIEAVVETYHRIDSKFYNQLIADVEHVLKVGFPQSRNPENSCWCEAVICGEAQLLLDIFHHAHKLTFMIHHNIVTCELMVTIAPAATAAAETYYDGSSTPSTNEGLGTYAFGLQRMHGSKQCVLIEPKKITCALFTDTDNVLLH